MKRIPSDVFSNLDIFFYKMLYYTQCADLWIFIPIGYNFLRRNLL